MREISRLAPTSTREWAEAMLGELEFVEGDWDASCWALGSAAAIVRSSGREWVALAVTQTIRWEERAMEQMGKKAGLMAAGALGAVALVAVAFGLLFLTAVLFPSLGLDRAEWTHVLFVVVIPMALCLAGVIWLWRTKRPVALGILLSVGGFGTHLAVHFASHFNGH
ncbi:MAG TPA: hypothetical protein VKQ72_21500 [Aggregatilineales bacterium]|nr:hypothetical protein [Aggregatilineales bacterium]